MATKPSTVPLWNTGGANNTAPSAGKIVLGWTNGERVASSYLNHRMKLYGEWCQYLSDGAFTGAHTFGSTVGITGAVTCSSTLGVSDTLTMSANKNIVISGTGSLKHGDRELQIAAPGFMVSAPAASWGSGSVAELSGGEYYFTNGAASVLEGSVPLAVGKRIKSILFAFNKGGSATNITFRLKKRTGSTTTTLATLTNGSSGSSVITDTMSAINYTIETGYRVWIEVTAGNSANVFDGCNITYDEP